MNTKTLTCYDCALFDRKQGVCIKHHMGDKPEYYDKPKWMGCSWRVEILMGNRRKYEKVIFINKHKG